MADHHQNSVPPFGANTNEVDEAEEFYKKRSQDSAIPPANSRRSSVRLSQVGSDLTSRFDPTTASSAYPQPSQPLSDAVTSAVQTTDSTMSPEVIQLITQRVYQNILHQFQNNPTSTTSAPAVQPPSNIPIDQPDFTSTSSNSPNLERAQVSTSEQPRRENRNSFTPGADPIMPLPRRDSVLGHDYDTTSASRKFSESNTANEAQPRAPKPEPVRRMSSDAGANVVEKIWGKLFDDQGEGTERLSQFLRGIAMHLIDEYEPKNSLVVTPDKMLKFYYHTRLTENTEIYPWHYVFDDDTSSLSRLFRESEIRAEHHLVQSNLETRPDIPGLTPQGFATWMTFLLKAHPDHEFERLTKTLKEMAIDNPDNKRERFPKELYRRQFPAVGDSKKSDKLIDFMSDHCKINLKSRKNSTTEPEQDQTPTSPRKAPPRPSVEDVTDEHDLQTRATIQDVSSQHSPTSKSIRPDKERAIFTDSDTSIEEDSSDVPTPQPRPIERERKPYTGQPGRGKNYDLPSPTEEHANIIPVAIDGSELRRTKSVSNQARPRMSAPIAIHQGGNLGNPAQIDGADLSRIQATTGGPDSSSRQRYRGKSNADVETKPYRRPRANSTYANDNGQRYHPSRTNSFNKGSEYVRTSVADSNYPTQGPNVNHSQGQHTNNGRPEYRSYVNYGSREPRFREGSRDRDREREREREARHSRTWNQNPVNSDQYALNSQDEYFRKQAQLSANGAGYQQYPPNSYRDRDGR